MWKISLSLLAVLVLPAVAHADGGMQKVAEGRYIVNISSAPITPYVSEQQNLLIGFADIQGNLLAQDIDVDIALKHGGDVILEKRDLEAENGVLPFQYTYEKPGLYELFVKFRLPEDPSHTYEPEDFMIDVKERITAPQTGPILPFLGGGAIGLVLGLFLVRLFPRPPSPFPP